MTQATSLDAAEQVAGEKKQQKKKTKESAEAAKGNPLSAKALESADRDVTKSKTEASFVALLRRVADAVEAGKKFQVQVKGKKLWIPETAMVSVEHEQEGNENELELQFKWTTSSK